MSARLLLLLLPLALLPGCGTSDDRDQARATVERFYAAVEAQDPAAACDQLGDALLEAVESQTQTQRACEDVIVGFEYEPGAVDRTEVHVTNAKVDLASGESAFLSRETDGWKLSAIACRPEKGKPADRPFECEAEA
jgi:hypothetical protein